MLATGNRRSGTVAIRRLNRTEYNNTIRDLFDLDVRPADEFPGDDIGYGFDNIGDVLSTPPILLEMYLAAATKVTAEAFSIPEIRARIMNPGPDLMPRVYRQYTPPVRTPRLDKTLPGSTPAAVDPELARQQSLYNILQAFCDRAFRRPATHDEVTRLLEMVLSAEKDGDGTDDAIGLALRAVLMSPHFLFLQNGGNRDPASPSQPLPTSDFALASRLSYFLWSTMPDEPLFQEAARGNLRRGDSRRRQVVRMLHDPRAYALAENFACQWLQIRKLKECTPDPGLFAEFDDALRDAMLTESVLLFQSVFVEDRSILDLIQADYAFLNERLAGHYGITGIRGAGFQRVSLSGSARGGVLTLGSVHAVTSNPNRTSPVKRGKWILETILGTMPPPPPSGVEALDERQPLSKAMTLRQQMARHQTDAACKSCHGRMDPLGFSLENFDAVGRWRKSDRGQEIDATGQLPEGEAFEGPTGLKKALLRQPDVFARCLAEKLLTYALGRGLNRSDRHAVDRIVATVKLNDYRFSALVIAIVESEPFLNL